VGNDGVVDGGSGGGGSISGGGNGGMSPEDTRVIADWRAELELVGKGHGLAILFVLFLLLFYHLHAILPLTYGEMR
jgi:hypothetical protein